MLLSAEHISINFGARSLLTDVNFYLEPGDKVGVIGINGTGKSTLLRILAGAEEPDGGTVTKITKTVLLGALWVLLAVLLLLLLLIFRRKLLRKRRERKYQLENINEAVSWIFADTAALLEKLGLRRGNGSMRALCEPAKQRFGGDYATALAEAIRLNDLALFSSHALTQAQRESALKFYADTRGSLKKNVKWYRRVWMKWVQCLY